jgi:mRNA-degrading endonuclease YafQ of YafQ-DinJ toxin-antitoxin module
VRGPEFQSTFLRAGDEVASTFKRWLDQKLKTPLQLVGYDKPFRGGGNYSGLSHAHMGQDVSIVYKLEGKEPRKLKLYGFFSHEDLGTGQPPKQKIQQKTGKRLKTQVFEKRKLLAE